MTHSNASPERSGYEPVEAANLTNDILDAIEYSSKTMPIANAERLLVRAMEVMAKMQKRIEELDDYYKP